MSRVAAPKCSAGHCQGMEIFYLASRVLGFHPILWARRLRQALTFLIDNGRRLSIPSFRTLYSYGTT